MRLKGILHPSHREPPQPVGNARGSGFRPGRRYPVAIQAALNLEDKLKDYLHKGEGVDLSRMTRFLSPSSWVVWTTEGRKIEVEVDHTGAIIEATIGDEPDPELPPRAR